MWRADGSSPCSVCAAIRRASPARAPAMSSIRCVRLTLDVTGSRNGSGRMRCGAIVPISAARSRALS